MRISPRFLSLDRPCKISCSLLWWLNLIEDKASKRIGVVRRNDEVDTRLSLNQDTPTEKTIKNVQRPKNR
jgi:hypothetical protein